MAFKSRNGSPSSILSNTSALMNASLQYSSENPIQSDATGLANEQTGQIREVSNPIRSIGLELEVTYTSTAGDAVLNGWGIWNLIKRIKLLSDSENVIYNLFGWYLPLFHREHSEQGTLPYGMLPSLSTPTGTVKAWVELPLDVGGYLSLLDASKFASLNLQVEFNADSAMATGDNFAITAAKVTPRICYVRGVEPGKRGGIGFDYLRNHAICETVPVTADAGEKEILMLAAGRTYHGLTIQARQGNVAYGTDAILDNVILMKNALQIGRFGQFQLKARLADKINAASLMTGHYQIPLCEDGHLEQLLPVVRGQTVRVLGDVNNSGATAMHLTIVSQFFS